MSQDILSVRPVFALFFPRRTSGCITICWLHRCNNSDIGFCSRFQKVAPIQFCFKIEPKNVRYMFAVASNDGTTQTTSFFYFGEFSKQTCLCQPMGYFNEDPCGCSFTVSGIPQKKMEYQIIVCVCEQLSDIPRGLSP